MKQLGIGIDLGTTHTALAYRSLEPSDTAPSTDFAIVQFVAAGKLSRQPLLPSFAYFAPEAEVPLALPWDPNREFAVGEYARTRASETPGRVVSSAKSWLSHAGVDRRAALLPLEPSEGVEPVSPVEAAFRYLDHLAEAWKENAPEGAAPLSEQEIVLTVPASFDAAARDLTVEAAYAAGLDNVTLLEEPQAALYGLMDALGDDWRSVLGPGDVALVIDVGGGTTDFSLIALVEAEGLLEPHRVAVGDHILLGGDNMDLQLAALARQKLVQDGKRLDRGQFASLVHGCRAAKERLLGPEAPDSVAVTIPNRGSQLVGNTLRIDVSRTEVAAQIVDGFFPSGAVSEHPRARQRSGLTEAGLPYASDPAVTRHLAAFLSRQVDALGSLGSPSSLGSSGSPSPLGTASVNGAAVGPVTFAHPTCVLFNGGVFLAPRLQERIIDTLNGWLAAEGAAPVRVLPSTHLDVAVARGASYYARARRTGGIRIRGGTAHAYYVGIESSMPAVPGMDPPINALCVAPFGMEEGAEPRLVERDLGLVVGEPVTFRFFTSTVRREDRVGTLLDDWESEQLEEIAPIRVTLPHEGRSAGAIVPVRLRACTTAVGTLLLEAVPVVPLTEGEAWQLELNLRR